MILGKYNQLSLLEKNVEKIENEKGPQRTFLHIVLKSIVVLCFLVLFFLLFYTFYRKKNSNTIFLFSSFQNQMYKCRCSSFNNIIHKTDLIDKYVMDEGDYYFYFTNEKRNDCIDNWDLLILLFHAVVLLFESYKQWWILFNTLFITH